MASSGAKLRSALLGGSPVIFVTIGSMFPFDRMIRIMDEWASKNRSEDMFAQIGGGAYQPTHMRWTRMIAPNEYKTVVRSSRLMVAHAGTGSVFTAAEFQKPIVLLPRRAAMKEHTTDHQLDTARWLEDKPGIFVAWTDDEVGPQIERAIRSAGTVQSQIPTSAPPEFLDRIREFLRA